MIHRYETPHMSLQQTRQSGQRFRMTPLPEDTYPSEVKNDYRLISGLRALCARQDDTSTCLDYLHESLSFWLSHLGMNRNYQAAVDPIDRENSYLTVAAMSGADIRILRQDSWEMIITFVISQQKTVPGIRQLVEALSNRYGTVLEDGQDLGKRDDRGRASDRERGNDREKKNDPGRCLPSACSLPAPSQLCLTPPDDLMGLRLGYRAKYICRLYQDVVSDRLELSYLSTLDCEGVMEHLIGLCGIGRKVANCVCLFGLHHTDAFLVDTWIEKILTKQYFDREKYRCIPKNRLCKTIIEDVFRRYSGCTGVMQQYIFYYERSVRQGRE